MPLGKHRDRDYIPGITRMLLATVASTLLFISPMLGVVEGEIGGPLGFIVLGLGMFFAFPIAILGFLGGIFNVWKRQLGGGMMLVAGLLGIFPALMSGGWGLLAVPILIGCGISSRWHTYR